MTERTGSAPEAPGLPGEPGVDRRWLRQAIGLSRRCPPSATAFSVGAIIVSADGEVLASGFSRERDPADHAEEVALAKAAGAGCPAGSGALAAATIYTSLEPCCRRASRPLPCAELIAAAGVRRVVLAWQEPPLFVPGGGAAWLRGRGVAVVEIPDLAAEARAVNAHLMRS
ncbi:MAG: deaminase [Streptosporangiaceae bacterium]|jgi:diaminohydroxyphosphoribosylaminopyrimidine deaminase/5-amino-6-(5-phosphoribosylamino)uracil reductase